MPRPKGKTRTKTMKRAKGQKGKKAASELTLMNLKVSDKDRKALVAAANKYAKGNLSAWLRFAGMHFRPAKTPQII